MIKIDLSEKTILVTGGLGAIGEFISRRLMEAGAKVILTDVVPPDEASARCDAWGLPRAQLRYLRMDVTRQDELDRTVKEVFAGSPGIDIAVGHAGGCAMHPFAQTSAEEYERIFEYNFHGQTRFARAVMREWLDRGIAGHLIFTSSLVGSLPWAALTSYAPAKAAVEMFSKCMALEFADRGIRFNCVAPGHVAAGSSLNVYQNDETYRVMVNRAIPLGRMVRPESIADALLWLCSPLGQDVNGQVIRVDCGASIPKVG